ncbi:MAG: HDOD domain-containing protein, partial [Proteobacteria bacterium]|nr:HDOD domain-containing protein [Pseudomonadota bacterium]
MALTPLDQLTAGMVLSGDLKSADGRLLFRSGTPLEARHIELLRRVGVSGAEVEPPASELPPETLREIEEYVRGFFLYANPDSAPVIAMFRMALEMTGEAVSKGWQLPDANTRRAASVEHMQDIFLKGMGTPETIARHETELASFPDIYFRIREVLEDESASSARIAKVVGTDMSLSAKLIKLVNSPLYGLSQPIDSISRAVTLVGAKELSTLALGISAINYFKDIPHELVDMRTFWR